MYKIVNMVACQTHGVMQRAEEEEENSSAAVVRVVSHYVIQMWRATI